MQMSCTPFTCESKDVHYCRLIVSAHVIVVAGIEEDDMIIFPGDATFG